MECEICGKKEAVFLVLVEGAKMLSCKSCAYYGKILHSLEEGIGEEPQKEAAVPVSMRVEEDIVEGYGKSIRKAREAAKIEEETYDDEGKKIRRKRGMTIEELAKKVNEKASYLDKVENERIRPTLEVARKLEKALGIKLIEKVKESAVEYKEKGKKELTLMDMMEMQKKREG